MAFASLYVKNDNPKLLSMDNVKATSIQGQIQQAFDTAKTSISGFNVKEFAQNITLQGATSFTQKYATAGLTKIINGEAITNTSMLEGLFNGFAPAMGMTAVQSGYNDIQEMRTAIQGGTINVTGFLNGFSGALNTIKNSSLATTNYTKYGDEITVDMLVDIDYQYISETPDRRVQSGQVYNEYIHNLPDVVNFNGKLKEGLNYTSNEYKDLLLQIRNSKKPFTLRVGTDIFEDYCFTSLIPAKNFEESLAFQCEIKKITSGEVTIEKVNIPKTGAKKVIKKNTGSNVGNAAKKVGNATAPKKLYGIGRIINLDQGVADLVDKLNEWK